MFSTPVPCRGTTSRSRSKEKQLSAADKARNNLCSGGKFPGCFPGEQWSTEERQPRRCSRVKASPLPHSPLLLPLPLLLLLCFAPSPSLVSGAVEERGSVRPQADVLGSTDTLASSNVLGSSEILGSTASSSSQTSGPTVHGRRMSRRLAARRPGMRPQAPAATTTTVTGPSTTPAVTGPSTTSTVTGPSAGRTAAEDGTWKGLTAEAGDWMPRPYLEEEEEWAGDHLTSRIARGGSSHPKTRRQLDLDYQTVPTCLHDGPASVTVNASNACPEEAVWKGWGTSLAWMGNYVGQLPEDQYCQLLDLLFSKDGGLGLNIVRYAIGGGWNAQSSPQFLCPCIRWRAMDGFLPCQGCPYNWTKDAAQRKVLLGAKRRGADVFIAFSGSPPWWMTNSGDVGGASGGNNNLNPDHISDFANYLADVVQQYATNPDWNITFQHLTPVNEPLEWWWKQGSLQEGCHMDANTMSQLYPLLSSALAVRNLSTQVQGVDSWVENTAQGLKDMDPVPSSFSVLTTHSYIYPKGSPGEAEDNLMSQVHEVARRLGKQVWQTEYDPYYVPQDELGVALGMARNIIECINILGASAWAYWQAIDNYSWFTLINLSSSSSVWDAGNALPYTLKLGYYALNLFTRFVPPGSYTIPPVSDSSCQHGISAMVYPGHSPWLVIFIVNEDSSPRDVDFNIQGFQSLPGAVVNIIAYRVSAAELGTEVARLGNTLPDLSVTSNPQSLTAIVITNTSFPVNFEPRHLYPDPNSSLPAWTRRTTLAACLMMLFFLLA